MSGIRPYEGAGSIVKDGPEPTYTISFDAQLSFAKPAIGASCSISAN